jgi:hypothetical protein
LTRRAKPAVALSRVEKERTFGLNFFFGKSAPK